MIHGVERTKPGHIVANLPKGPFNRIEYQVRDQNNHKKNKYLKIFLSNENQSAQFHDF